MKKASKIIAIFIFTMSIFVGVGAVEVLQAQHLRPTRLMNR